MVWQPLWYAQGVLFELFYSKWLEKAELGHFGLLFWPSNKFWDSEKKKRQHLLNKKGMATNWFHKLKRGNTSEIRGHMQFLWMFLYSKWQSHFIRVTLHMKVLVFVIQGKIPVGLPDKGFTHLFGRFFLQQCIHYLL